MMLLVSVETRGINRCSCPLTALAGTYKSPLHDRLFLFTTSGVRVKSEKRPLASSCLSRPSACPTVSALLPTAQVFVKNFNWEL